jgi:hypothetical protein
MYRNEKILTLLVEALESVTPMTDRESPIRGREIKAFEVAAGISEMVETIIFGETGETAGESMTESEIEEIEKGKGERGTGEKENEGKGKEIEEKERKGK